MRNELIRTIAQAGLRVFDKKDVIKIAEKLGFSKSYLPRLIPLMVKSGIIISVGKGLYTFPPELLSGGPIHSFELAIKLARKGAISHRSAMEYYALTDQVFSRVYITVPRENGSNLSTTKEYVLNGVRYHLIRIAPKNYWGIENVFLGEAKISITNLEKTLIDGLSNPEHCGGFREVLFAFERGISKVSVSLLFEYAQKTSLAACKRLGWVLEQLEEHKEIQEQISLLPMPYYQKLDAAGNRRGKLNQRWHLMENI